jgi:Werner syndrome ATP-dependent helicase
MDERLKTYNKVLTKYWGYSSLKEKQFEIIDNVVFGKKDVLGVLATGFGKSICYQLPYLLTKKCVVIISPLLALMKDQQQDLEKRGIPVCCLNSDCYDKQGEIEQILDKNYKIIYITPEYLVNCEDFLKQLYKQNGLALIAIDESHCVSTWSDFRVSYTQLTCIKKWLKNIPVIALTATATTKVRADIISVLSLNNPVTVVGDFDRPNLYIQVRHKGKNLKSDIEDLIDKYRDEYIIIYCKTRDETESIAKTINSWGTESYAYHAGLSAEKRKDIQDGFTQGLYKVIICTVAFGMGIDIPNIRLVLHYSCPKNLESYYQEIGRAGRDGKQSDCYLFYSTKDFILNRLFLDKIADRKHREYQEMQIRSIERYVHTSDCRRKLLLKEFSDKPIVNNCNNCDNCCRGKEDVVVKDVSVPAYQMLNTINSLDISYGGITYINILRGSNAKNIKYNMKQLSTYGKGNNHTPEWWKFFIQLLLNNNYLKSVHIGGGYGSTLQCTDVGKNWLIKIKTKYKSVNEIANIDKLMLPITKELQSIDSTLSNKKIITEPIAKKTSLKKIDDVEVEDVSNGRKKWTVNEEKLLLKEIKDGLTINDIATNHGRTISAIKHRQRHIASTMHTRGKKIEEIVKTTGLTDDQVKYEIKRLNTQVVIIKGKKPKVINKEKILNMDDGDTNLESEFTDFLNKYNSKIN